MTRIGQSRCQDNVRRVARPQHLFTVTLQHRSLCAAAVMAACSQCHRTSAVQRRKHRSESMHQVEQMRKASAARVLMESDDL